MADKIRAQQLTENATGATYFVQEPVTTDYGNQHQPSSSQLAAKVTALTQGFAAGYSWVRVSRPAESYMFTGALQGGYRMSGASQDENPPMLSIVPSFSGGRGRIADTSSPTLQSYEAEKYVINSRVKANGDYYTKSDLAGLSFPPEITLLLQKIIVDTRRSKSAWRDNPNRNASILIRWK